MSASPRWRWQVNRSQIVLTQMLTMGQVLLLQHGTTQLAGLIHKPPSSLSVRSKLLVTSEVSHLLSPFTKLRKPFTTCATRRSCSTRDGKYTLAQQTRLEHISRKWDGSARPDKRQVTS